MRVIDCSLFRQTFSGMTSTLVVEVEGLKYVSEITVPPDYVKNRTKEQAESSMKVQLSCDIIDAIAESLRDELRRNLNEQA